jgi:hypothetical protein
MVSQLDIIRLFSEIQNLLLYNAGAADTSQLTFNQTKSGLNISATCAAAPGPCIFTFSPHVNTVGVGTTPGPTFGMMTPCPDSNDDLFNQSQGFRRDLVGLTTSSVEINNIPLTPQPLKPWEMFKETLISLGNTNLDMTQQVYTKGD